MARMFIRHSVNDYKVWRKVYDHFDGERKQMGVTAHAVYQAAANPNELTIWHDFADVGAAEKFAGSDRLREVMANAGVTSKPDVWFTNAA